MLTEITDPRRPFKVVTGDLSMVFNTGDLFKVKWRGVDVIQRLYMAVRDRSWNTIPAEISNVVVDDDPASTTINFDAQHIFEEIAFLWHGCIRATEDGTVVYEMTGRALSDFEYCKIGLNIHHALRSYAGRAFSLESTEGRQEGVFPLDIAPQLVSNGTLTAMTAHFDRLDVSLEGAEVKFAFEGDRFEIQDHRNWSDANWKTYGTPLEFGFPMRIAVGDALYQKVTVIISGLGIRREVETPTTCLLANSIVGPLPQVGHLLTQLPSEQEMILLRELKPSHIRVDLHPSGNLHRELDSAVRIADQLNCTLEVGAFIRPEAALEDVTSFAQALEGRSIVIIRLLVLAETSGFSEFRGACPPEVGDAMKSALRAHGLLVGSVISGTGQFFSDINRDRPDYSQLDGIVFSVNPQVHASDDISMMQNAEAIPDIVAFVRRLYGEIQVSLSPVHLVGINGPYPAGPSAKGGRAPNEDPRQQTAFCAAWTVTALAQMARCRTTSVTAFDLVGARGLLGPDLERLPIFRLLSALGEVQNWPLCAVQVSDTEKLAALAFTQTGVVRAFIANLLDQPQEFSLGQELKDVNLKPVRMRSITHGVGLSNELEFDESNCLTLAAFEVVICEFRSLTLNSARE